jgi:hypothetical protein
VLSGVRKWWLRKAASWQTTTTRLRGIEVRVYNTRLDVDTPRVLARLDLAFGLIEQYCPHYFRHLSRDFTGILVQRYACRGAYFPDTHICLVELTFSVNPAFTPTQIAATILHEAMHARLHRLGFPLDMSDRVRQERFCRRAEIEFGQIAPDGRAVLDRALATLEAADEDVAPVIDASLAARRVAEADLRALPVPTWLKRSLARRQGLGPLD